MTNLLCKMTILTSFPLSAYTTCSFALSSIGNLELIIHLDSKIEIYPEPEYPNILPLYNITLVPLIFEDIVAKTSCIFGPDVMSLSKVYEGRPTAIIDGK